MDDAGCVRVTRDDALHVRTCCRGARGLVSARSRAFGHRFAASDLSSIEGVQRTPKELLGHADEGVALPNSNVVDLVDLEALVLEDALEVTGLGAVFATDVHEDFSAAFVPSVRPLEVFVGGLPRAAPLEVQL